ncbi:MAG: DUF455 family protein [Verrucomicrobiota bacterium]
MELREFAEQVLFSTSIEQKLQVPDVITDERPGSALVTPASPGRPAHLHFKPHGTGSKSEFPGLQRLERQDERGKLLHFFANHELLATELMALVLLKFPDAPAAFRKGVLETLKDEQEHTRWYIERIRACGIEFGELPVSGYFWRCVSPMENPIDYVAGLCLTFEQANLDFAGHFAKGFATVGDADTAKLLGKIYRDEIGHVAYGLKWFRRWKNPTENDWEAFCRTLKFPLSPQRAKGFSLNVEGRRAAGLDAQFIAELNVYSQSKGRTPSVFVFNPFAEGRIAEGRTFNANQHQAQLARDLANLPQFLCRQDDLVLVGRKPSVEFLSGIKQAGFPLPEFFETASLAGLRARKLGRLRPWAWGPDSFDLLRPLFANVTGEQRCDEARFNATLAGLYSKSWSADFLREILPRSDQGWLCTENEAGTTARTLDQALSAIRAIRARGHHRIVVKEALGLAGSNAMRLFEPEVLESHQRWMSKALQNGRALVVEPWLDRLQDFSIQLEMSGDGLKLCGFTGLVNDAKGQFQGNWAESHHHKRIPGKVVSLFEGIPDISTRMLEFYEGVFKTLAQRLQQADFTGPAGIDAFVYRDAVGAVRLKPVVEINPRYTMGRLMVELMKQACPGSSGEFHLFNAAQLRQPGFATFADLAASLRTRFPLELEGEPVRKIHSGAVCLNDPSVAQVCLAVFQVHPRPPGG